MSFTLESSGYYRPSLFETLPWIYAGFGTRGAVAPGPELATAHQVHSAKVVQVTSGGAAGTADALIADRTGIKVGVKTADCVPILMVDRRNRAVAAVHAGWRGTAQRIVPAVLASMKQAFGTEGEDLVVAIGPAIGPCCYEVGAEVARALGIGDSGMRVDLAQVNFQQLEGLGVTGDRIDCAKLCTFCGKEDFYSFRRERELAGRMLSIVGIV